MWDTIFRPYRASHAEHSDRSAGDRLRHREKVRQSIRDNIADIIAEEAIIAKDGNRIIKVPIRGVKEYRFIHGENARGSGQSDHELSPGDIIADDQGQGKNGSHQAGNQPGVDYYETDVTLEELIGIMFEDLELPDLERKKLREITAERQNRRKGYRSVGIHVRLDKRRTVKEKLRRRLASHKMSKASATRERFPFHKEDLTYRHMTPDIKTESNAVVICMMDTSGSMDTMKKYLARSFFFLLCQFVNTKYRNVEIVFLAHHTQAQEVAEEEFFSKGESGGTLISSVYEKALEIIAARYHPSLWNIYAFHCSDGDNYEADNELALRRARNLCELCNLLGYGEIQPHGYHAYQSSMMAAFKTLHAPNFMTLRIERKEDVYPSFRNFLSKERVPQEQSEAAGMQG
jgi:sporulation protein YhbH